MWTASVRSSFPFSLSDKTRHGEEEEDEEIANWESFKLIQYVGEISIRSPKPNPLRLHPPTLPHLAPPLLLRPRLPHHGAAPRASETPHHRYFLFSDDHVPDPVAERSLPGQRVCEIREPVRDPERGCVCGAITRYAVLRGRGGVVLACKLGGAEHGGRE